MIHYMFSREGPLNTPEYGALDNDDGFRNLLEINAYCEVKDEVNYLAVLLTAGINDPHVVPGSLAKWRRGCKAANGRGKPILLSMDYEGGQG